MSTGPVRPFVAAAIGAAILITLGVGVALGILVSGGDGEPPRREATASTAVLPTATRAPATLSPSVTPPVPTQASAPQGASTPLPPAVPAEGDARAASAEDEQAASAAPTAPAPPPTPAPAQPSADCAACGAPRYFCDSWSGGFCNDYRQLGDTTFEVPFPPVSEAVTFDCFSSTDPGYYPTMNAQNAAEGAGPVLASPCAFSKHEHFMTRMEDGNFGMAVLRFHQPFDFAGRTGHVRFDIDLKTSARRYVRVMLAPEITKALTDDRAAADRRPGTALDVWFRDGQFSVSSVRGGAISSETLTGRYYGSDDVRDTVDLYVSRTGVRIDVNGTTFVDQGLPDLGFDRAYVYLSQVSYNPCKDGQCSEREQVFHWDNVAFDGPVLQANSLVPPGQRDVVFNVFRASNCSVAGIPATPAGSDPTGAWTTFRVRIPDDGAPVGPEQVACAREVEREGWDAVQSFEIVRSG